MRFFLIIFFVVLFFRSEAQDTWSLEKCINYALEKNIQVKMQDLSLKNYQMAYLKSKMSFLPNLNASANQSYTLGRSVDALTNEFAQSNVRSNSFSLSGSINIFNGFQTIHSVQQNHLNLLAAIEDLQKAKNDLSLNIASAFLQILFNDELFYVSQNQVDLSKEQVERTRKLYEAGSVAQGNYLEMQSQLASDEMQLVTAKNTLDLSYLTLSQYLDLGFNDSMKIEKPSFSDPDFSIQIESPDDIYKEAVQKLPQIRSAELKMKSAFKGLDIARGYRSPHLTLNGVYSTGYSSQRKDITDISMGEPFISGFYLDNSGNPIDVYTFSNNYKYSTPSFNKQLNDNISKSLTFSLTIPIFNNWQANYAVSSARINALNAQYLFDESDKQLRKEIQQAYTDATASYRKYVATKKAVTATQESFKYIVQKFEIGMTTSVDYNLAKNNLAKARSELIKAKYEYIFRLKIIDFYRGIPIKL
jgi:outer membrane protein